MRSYTIAIAALAIGAPHRWMDNILSQFTIPDVISVRRGVARKLSYAAIVRLAIVRQLHTELGIGTGDAVRLTAKMLYSETAGVLESGHLTLSVNWAEVERTENARLADALESHPNRRRGRPPGKAAQTTGRRVSSTLRPA